LITLSDTSGGQMPDRLLLRTPT